MKKAVIISYIFSLLFAAPASSQNAVFSLATDFDIQHSFLKDQKYWAVGQTIHFHFNFTPKEGMYVWISYYSDGKFRNNLTATAKSPVTTPQQQPYINSAEMRFKHISVGWKHYLKGQFDIENHWNLYAYAGLGLMLGRVINTYDRDVDTSLYKVPVVRGKANFKRLTLDLGLGYEAPIGYDVYFYTEARVWVPITDYPSNYIFVNKNAPLAASFNLGLRFLFD